MFLTNPIDNYLFQVQTLEQKLVVLRNWPIYLTGLVIALCCWLVSFKMYYFAHIIPPLFEFYAHTLQTHSN